MSLIKVVDLFPYFLKYIDYQGVLNLSLTCKNLYKLTNKYIQSDLKMINFRKLFYVLDNNIQYSLIDFEVYDNIKSLIEYGKNIYCLYKSQGKIQYLDFNNRKKFKFSVRNINNNTMVNIEYMETHYRTITPYYGNTNIDDYEFISMMNKFGYDDTNNFLLYIIKILQENKNIINLIYD